MSEYTRFGKDLYKYTIKKLYQKDLGVFLQDEAVFIILNCTGHIGDISDELKVLLH